MPTSPPVVKSGVEQEPHVLAQVGRIALRFLELLVILCSLIDTGIGLLIIGNLGSMINQFGFRPPQAAVVNALLFNDLLALWPHDPVRFVLISAVVLGGLVGFKVDGSLIPGGVRRLAGRATRRSSATPSDDGQQPAESPQLTQATAFALLRGMEAERGNDLLYAFLKWKYGADSKFNEPIFERNGITFPLAVYPAAPTQVTDPESALIRPVLNRFPPRETLIRDSTMRNLILKAGLRADNLETFAMRDLVVTDSVTMSCQKGKYLDMFDTCDSLEWEIMHAASSLRQGFSRSQDQARKFEQFDKRLPLRNLLHSQVANPVRSGEKRSVAVSLSCLIAFYQDDRVYLMVRKRSTNVAVHLGLFHIVPSFMFQPATDVLETEYSLLHNIQREYLEELFDRPDPLEGEVDPFYFFGDPRLQELQDMMQSGVASWYYTGVAVNLLSLRPEICTLMLIRDSTWYQRHLTADPSMAFRPHFEFAYNFQNVDNEIPIISNVPMLSTDEQIAQSIEISPRTMVPCGAFAFWAGVDLLRSLPEIQARMPH